jgi:RHS repeat-associated protein
MPTAAQLSENSHQGFDGIKAAFCLGSMQAKPNTASGMPVCLWREGTGSRSSGKERDAETGLDFFLARYYSGAQGRFLSPDPGNAGASPEDPHSWNAYAYARNNPLIYTDPDGLSYRLCDASGNCIDDYDDMDFAQNFKWGYGVQLIPSGSGGGMIIADGVYIGSYQYNGFFFDEVEKRLGNQADATNQLIGNLMVNSVVSGVTGFAIGQAVQAGVKAYAAYRGAQAVASEAESLIIQAAQTVGNKGAVAASKESALAAAEQWVGVGARPIYKGGEVIGKVSADGQRIYRITSINKAQPYVNMVNKTTGGNLHVRF